MEEKSVVLDNKEYVYDSDNPLGAGASYTSFIARESKSGSRKILKIHKANQSPSVTILAGFDDNNRTDKNIINDLSLYNDAANFSEYLNNHIVQADFYKQHDEIYILQDYSNGIILADLNKITYKNFIDIVYQISKIVLELSSNSILLLDLKLSNFIYLTNSNTVKLFDYDAITNKERLCIENISDINKIFLKTTLSLAAPEVTFCYDLIDKANKKRYISCDEFKKIKYALSNINDYSVTYMMGGSIENLFNRIEIVNYDLDFETKKTVNYIIKNMISSLTSKDKQTRLDSYNVFLILTDLKRFVDKEYCDFKQLPGMSPFIDIIFSNNSPPILKKIENEYLSYCARIINKKTIYGNIEIYIENLKNKGNFGHQNRFQENNALLSVFTDFNNKMYGNYKNCDRYEYYKKHLADHENDFLDIGDRAQLLNYFIRFNNEIYHLETCHIHKLPDNLLSFYKGKIENKLKLINSNDLYCYYYYIFARAYEIEFNFARSIDLLFKCKEVSEEKLEVNFLLFSTMLKIGQYKEAIGILEEIVESKINVEYIGYFECFKIEKIDDIWSLLIFLYAKINDAKKVKRYVDLYLDNTKNLDEKINRNVYVVFILLQLLDFDEALSEDIIKLCSEIKEHLPKVDSEYMHIEWIYEFCTDFFDFNPELKKLFNTFDGDIDESFIKNNKLSALAKASFSPYKIYSYSIYKNIALQEIEIKNYKKAYEMFCNIVSGIKEDKSKNYSMYYTYWHAENLIYLGFCAFHCKRNDDETRNLREAYNILDTIGILDKFDLLYLYVYGDPFNSRDRIKCLSIKGQNSTTKVGISFSNERISGDSPLDITYKCRVSANYSGVFSEWGLTVWQGSDEVAIVKRIDNPCNSDYLDASFNSREYNIPLIADTEYTYRFYAVFDDVIYYDNVLSHKTGKTKEKVTIPLQITFTKTYVTQNGYDFSDITFFCKISANYSGVFSEWGLTVWQGSDEVAIARHVSTSLNRDHLETWFNSKAYAIPLTANTEYTYGFYAVFDGATYYSDTMSYRTSENIYLKL